MASSIAVRSSRPAVAPLGSSAHQPTLTGASTLTIQSDQSASCTPGSICSSNAPASFGRRHARMIPSGIDSSHDRRRPLDSRRRWGSRPGRESPASATGTSRSGTRPRASAGPGSRPCDLTEDDRLQRLMAARVGRTTPRSMGCPRTGRPGWWERGERPRTPDRPGSRPPDGGLST